MTISNLIFAGAIACVALPIAGNAQTFPPNDYGMVLNRAHVVTEEPASTVTESSVDNRAVSHFHKAYPTASDASWTHDRSGASVQFTLSNQEVVEKYTTKGRWVSTILTVSVLEVPRKVKEMARVQYPRYKVNAARHVKAWDGECYVLDLQGENDSKVILVTDEYIQVLPIDNL